ncbi:TetR-like C-terminal domain-containing protein [Streptomyces sp. M19]
MATVMRGAYGALAAELRGAGRLEPSGDPLRALHAMAHAYCRFIMENPRRYRLMFGVEQIEIPGTGWPVTPRARWWPCGGTRWRRAARRARPVAGIRRMPMVRWMPRLVARTRRMPWPVTEVRRMPRLVAVVRRMPMVRRMPWPVTEARRTSWLVAGIRWPPGWCP